MLLYAYGPRAAPDAAPGPAPAVALVVVAAAPCDDAVVALGSAAASCGDVLAALGFILEAPVPWGGGLRPPHTVPPPATALRSLARGPGPGGAFLPASFLPRALSMLRLGGRVVCRTRPGAMLAFAALSQHVHPGRLTEYAWARLIGWAWYLVHTFGLQLTMRAAVAS